MADDRLIPPSLRDANGLAYNEMIDKMGSVNLTPLLVYIIDIVAESALLHLADQFHILGNEGWNAAQTTDQKRALIKGAIETHRFKGTLHAIKKVLEPFGFQVNVIEHFQYNGAPFTYKIVISNFNEAVDQAQKLKIHDLVTEFQNERSEFEIIWIDEGLGAPVPVIESTLDTIETCKVEAAPFNYEKVWDSETEEIWDMVWDSEAEEIFNNRLF